MFIYESWSLDYYCLYMIKVSWSLLFIYVKDVIVRLALGNVHLKMLEDKLF